MLMKTSAALMLPVSIFAAKKKPKPVKKTSPAKRPNILIILADDSGYSDLGCYGGEIDTPNLDKLAYNGMRFQNFYTNARCSPTRASLMTGRDCAFAGFGAGTLGGWGREMKQPTYRARLSYNLPTVAELMKASGYHTMMAGKWHLGGSPMKKRPAMQTHWKRTHPGWELTPKEIEDDFNALPAQRGFDDFFGTLKGETHHFISPDDKHEYLEGNNHAKLSFEKTYNMHCQFKQKDKYPFTKNHEKTGRAFYATDGITDRAIEMIKNASGKEKPPFFMYMAYRAPHLPLQAPQELVDKYLSRYNNLAKVEKERVEGLVREKLLPAGTDYRKKFESDKKVPKKKADDLKLRYALHAAMVEKIDENVGRVVSNLKKLGELDNTLILYMSDNGAAMHVADMMNKPYYGCKAFLWEGGAKTHCIAHWPKEIKPGTITDSVGWVGDLLPTCLAVAGGTYPSEFRGTKTSPLDGRNILPVLKGKEVPPPEHLFFNDRGQQVVVFQGRWKLLIEPGWYKTTLKEPGIKIELYDLKNDPAETKDLSKKKPDLVKQLTEKCKIWQKKCEIVDYAEILKMRPTHGK